MDNRRVSETSRGLPEQSLVDPQCRLSSLIIGRKLVANAVRQRGISMESELAGPEERNRRLTTEKGRHQKPRSKRWNVRYPVFISSKLPFRTVV